MRKRRFRIFLWFLAMGGLVFVMLSVVNSFRKDRGQTQIEEAYQLLDQGELSQAVEKLEEARETYDMVDQHFPEMDTLFALHLRLKNWTKAENIIHWMTGTISDREWLSKMSRLTDKTLDHDPALAVSMAFEIISVDQQLNMIPYPPAIDSVLGEALEENLIRDGDFRGFVRKDDWSDNQREWWYYVADDDEEIEYREFRNITSKAFRDRNEIVIDVFRPLPSPPEGKYREMGFYGRILFSGESFRDSVFLPSHRAIIDSLDQGGRRLSVYAEWFGWDLIPFLWNTTLMDPPMGTPLYEHIPYLILRERIRQHSPDRLLRVAEERGLLIDNDSRDDCYDGQDVNCWTIDRYWLQEMPEEFVDLWKEKFPDEANRLKPAMTSFEARKMALARELSDY